MSKLYNLPASLCWTNDCVLLPGADPGFDEGGFG